MSANWYRTLRPLFTVENNGLGTYHVRTDTLSVAAAPFEKQDDPMVVKRLTRQGNSSALVIDKPILDLMDINQDTALKLTVNGRQLIVEPLSDLELEGRFEKAMKKTGKKNAELFRRLAK